MAARRSTLLGRALTAGLLALAGCHGATPAPASRAEALTFHTLTYSPGADQSERALASLRRIDDHPLFEMTYDGPAPRLAPPGAKPREIALPADRDTFACTVFLAAGDAARPVLGRNFDWDHNPALVLHSRPPDAYDSISLVDLSYLGFDHARLAKLDDPASRRDLLLAPTLPFDGLNEHGLAVGMAQVDGQAQVRPGAPVVGSLAVVRLALDTARTVDEAVRVFESYTLDWSGAPALHYLVADAKGDSAVIEFATGTMTVTRGDGRWQLMTNFNLSTSSAAERDADWRYATGSKELTSAGGRLDPGGAMSLLRTLRQGHTQWSVVYDLKAGTAAVATGQRYDRVHHSALRR
ncbi:carcinine hydrolase/isopenicillin-N N-acyltransferase family protein [Phytohabitans kaempferiae]|uniref:Carcinine hydrolase/isopenicillin-N N-acyltransferase family protein n=1 Tax=Phytohabitans kaempferiae TaxID=1620943 RepID=A0ABV6M031_9ACTN